MIAGSAHPFANRGIGTTNIFLFAIFCQSTFVSRFIKTIVFPVSYTHLGTGMLSESEENPVCPVPPFPFAGLLLRDNGNIPNGILLQFLSLIHIWIRDFRYPILSVINPVGISPRKITPDNNA